MQQSWKMVLGFREYYSRLYLTRYHFGSLKCNLLFKMFINNLIWENWLSQWSRPIQTYGPFLKVRYSIKGKWFFDTPYTNMSLIL